MFEVQDHPRFASRDAKIVDHLTNMFIRNGINRFDFHDHPAFHLKIGNVVVNMFAMVMNRMDMLLVKNDILALEFDTQSLS